MYIHTCFVWTGPESGNWVQYNNGTSTNRVPAFEIYFRVTIRKENETTLLG